MNRIIQFIILLLMFENLSAMSIVGSKHDLSVTNYYGAYSGASTEVCVFCHTPHLGNVGFEGPLWNRRITDTTTFTLYNGTSGAPNNASMICLSCHDGVSGRGDESAVAAFDTHNVVNSPGMGHDTNPATPNCNACHFSGDIYPGKEWRIGPDLTNDHPVSILYRDDLIEDFLASPTGGVKLYNGMVECASCHDVHNGQNGIFLRVPNNNSGLCKSCHIR